MIWTNELKSKKSSFDINLLINTKVDRLKIIKGNLYVYIADESIIIYDSKTFKLKANLELPFKSKNLLLEILDNEVLIFLAKDRLYFYEINIQEKKLTFLHYLYNIYNFHYLSKRKEIILSTKSYEGDQDEYIGMAKCDLKGNIILFNKITPNISKIFVAPEKTKTKRSNGIFNEFYGLCDDKYIINIHGYLYGIYDYKTNFTEGYADSSINIYNADNLKGILKEKYPRHLNCWKIADNLFKLKEREFLFYYNEKENKIEFINNIFNYLNNVKDNNLNNQYEEEYDEDCYYWITFDLKNPDKSNYIYLSDKLFAFYDYNENLFIVDISNETKVVRKIETSWDKSKYFIRDLLYVKEDNKSENLYICLKKKVNQIEGDEGKIIHGIIRKE